MAKMKIVLLIFGIFMMISCQSKKQKIVYDRIIINKNGDKLKLKSTDSGKFHFKFKTEEDSLTQIRMGSGIKYENAKYSYQEWHGNIELKKEGKIIFERKLTDIKF